MCFRGLGLGFILRGDMGIRVESRKEYPHWPRFGVRVPGLQALELFSMSRSRDFGQECGGGVSQRFEFEVTL